MRKLTNIATHPIFLGAQGKLCYTVTALTVFEYLDDLVKLEDVDRDISNGKPRLAKTTFKKHQCKSDESKNYL